jgi:hypothetical protein
MVGALCGLQMAHADLQQGNVLVASSGEIKLIDYDGMYVPAMQGEKAPELGHPNWNHPRRNRDTFGPYLDQLPGLVGYLSLLAVAIEPPLLDRHCDGENIILSKGDLADPDNSSVLQYLKKFKDPLVQKLAAALIAWCKGRVDEYTLDYIIGRTPFPTTPRPTQKSSRIVPPKVMPGVASSATTVTKRTLATRTPVAPSIFLKDFIKSHRVLSVLVIAAALIGVFLYMKKERRHLSLS